LKAAPIMAHEPPAVVAVVCTVEGTATMRSSVRSLSSVRSVVKPLLAVATPVTAKPFSRLNGRGLTERAVRLELTLGEHGPRGDSRRRSRPRDDPEATMTLKTSDWLQLNLGIRPGHQVPLDAIKIGKRPSTPEDFQREIIDFDSEGSEGAAFFAFATTATGLSKFRDIPWPKGLAPRPATRMPGRGSGALPHADVLVVTWTVDEGHALSRVLTPGFDSHNDWEAYTHNFAAISKKMRKGSPALEAGRLGTYWMTTIGDKKVLCFKSDSHLSQDGPRMPNFDLWKQLIAEVQPRLVITTGTGGGIGKQWEVGDVIVSPIVRFDCSAKFKREPFAQAEYRSPYKVRQTRFKEAAELFRANAAQLPGTNRRKIPEISVSKSLRASIVTTDFFGFDDVENTFKLQGLGSLSEMGDAVLGDVAKGLGKKAPPYVIVRNVSDPQINEPTESIKQQGHDATAIYKGYGRWSSVCSAIACWALIA
jgi:nucleoside phosphorylase